MVNFEKIAIYIYIYILIIYILIIYILYIYIMSKGLIFLMNALPDVFICSLRKKSAPLPEGTLECTHLANSRRVLTEIN